MIVKFIEVTRGTSVGRFAVMQFDDEWDEKSRVENFPLLELDGWSKSHVFIVDLITGEGAFFRPRKDTKIIEDLNKHKIWISQVFPEFLSWLYAQNLTNLNSLPSHVILNSLPPTKELI